MKKNSGDGVKNPFFLEEEGEKALRCVLITAAKRRYPFKNIYRGFPLEPRESRVALR